ncbi:MAG: type II secretion system F family protein [Clostridiales bacterium]|nr:type II secretion system F family protein [Clostridiales bacterium]
MDKFKYQAISKDGAKVSGVMEAFNEMDAVERIKQTCNVIIKVEEIKEKGAAGGILSMEIGKKKLDTKAFTLMCSQFSIILHSGIAITKTVELIAKQMTDKNLKKMLEEVHEDIQGGRSLSASFEDRGKDLLPVLFVETLRAGEMTGNFESAFESMAQHFDTQTKTKQKVKGALTYPIFVMIIAIVVVIILMVKVVPTFTAMFNQYGSDLPAITKSLIFVSNFFKKYGILIIAIIFIAFISYKVYSKTPNGKLKCGSLALKMPGFGNISVLNAASQFSNNMAALLRAGIGITEALRVVSRIVSNQYMSHELGKMAGMVEEGNSIGDCLRQNQIMPDILVDMVTVGEETGQLDDTLDTISRYYDNELDVAVSALLSKLEPAMLCFVAGVAGYIVLAIYIAMFQMYGIM